MVADGFAWIGISLSLIHICKEKKLQKQRSRDAPGKPQGKQTVKQLIGQNQGVSNIEITDPSIKAVSYTHLVSDDHLRR